MADKWWREVEIKRAAYISDDGLYRYELSRIWDHRLYVLVWVMLNPSKADGKLDDPTMLKVMTFSRAMGFGGSMVFNLAAYRSASPREMMAAEDPFGPENEKLLSWVCRVPHATVVAAWGAGGEVNKWPAQHREQLHRIKLKVLSQEWACLGMTKTGEPRHPLYLPYSSKLSRMGANL